MNPNDYEKNHKDQLEYLTDSNLHWNARKYAQTNVSVEC